MTIRRTIEVGSAAHLRVNLAQLVISRDGDEHSIPFEDIGFLILDNAQITSSQSVFHHCAKHNVALIITDEKHLPASLLLPLDVHSTQGKTMRKQAMTPEELQHKIWQQLIKAKITAQATALSATHGIENTRLIRLAKTVRPNDEGQNEGQASRIYFKLLFGKDFKRDQGGSSDVNILLNYGYSLIRTASARALMGAGLHPAFGIHHHNQYNVFCLADDIVEPLRPLVDRCVVKLSQAETFNGLDRYTKNQLLEILGNPVLIKKRKLPLMSALAMYCSSLRKILETYKGRLTIPVAIE